MASLPARSVAVRSGSAADCAEPWMRSQCRRSGIDPPYVRRSPTHDPSRSRLEDGALIPIDPGQRLQPRVHRLFAGRSRRLPNEALRGRGNRAARAAAASAVARFGCVRDHLAHHAVDLAIEIGQRRIGADRLLHRAPRGGAIEARLVARPPSARRAAPAPAPAICSWPRAEACSGLSLSAAPKSASACGRSPFLRQSSPRALKTSASVDRAAAQHRNRRWRDHIAACGQEPPARAISALIRSGRRLLFIVDQRAATRS